MPSVNVEEVPVGNGVAKLLEVDERPPQVRVEDEQVLLQHSLAVLGLATSNQLLPVEERFPHSILLEKLHLLDINDDVVMKEVCKTVRTDDRTFIIRV